MGPVIDSAFTLLDSKLPVLATAIHAGHQLGPEMDQHCGIPEADRLREEDPYTDEAAALFANHIILRSSRFEVDLNRLRDKAVYLVPEDCWGLPVSRQNLPPHIIASLYSEYDQWYAHLDFCIKRMLSHHPFIVVLDLHSYNHRRGGPNAHPDPQESNPDIIIGRSNMSARYHKSVESLRARLDGQSWQGRKLDCRADVKFPGGYLARYLNAHYSDHLFCLAIEFKKTFMDEWTGQLDRDAWDELKGLFKTAVDEWLPEVVRA